MKIIIANLKKNRITKEYVNELSKIKTDNKVIVLPCNDDLNKYSFKNVFVGTQNIIDEDYSYVLLGHKDVRGKETDRMINNKIKKCIEKGIKIILCVDSIDTLKKDLIDINNYSDIIIAYEEDKFIGTSQILTKSKIREFVRKAKKVTLSKSQIIYGGGINEENLSIIKEIKELDGILVGNQSKSVSNLISIINKY
ncbi:MAG: triose-phosphate isomerase [Bacilli bacterium]|nr:triose-phosphate isomerase [Bacilli bacterium]